MQRTGDLDKRAAAESIASEIGQADHYVLAPIDGLGMDLVERLAEDSFLRPTCDGVAGRLPVYDSCRVDFSRERPLAQQARRRAEDAHAANETGG
ncbi:MAG: hypothetical protein IIC88_06765 [Chloroflexi bacterium]|nr:hypothetical protein [Chloroflexota bacterium]